MAPKLKLDEAAPHGDCSRTLRVSPVGILARYTGHETVGEREGTDPPDRWSVRARCSLASEMPLTGVQYREKFEEETHRIVYQCTRCSCGHISCTGGKDFSIYGQGIYRG